MALSRVKSLEGLQLKEFHPTDFRASPKVLEWAKKYLNKGKLEENISITIEMQQKFEDNKRIAQERLRASIEMKRQRAIAIRQQKMNERNGSVVLKSTSQ